VDPDVIDRRMKPAPFTYHRPASVAEALEVLGAYGEEAKPLAGGQSLVPMLALRLARFEHLVDLNAVSGLAGLRRENGQLVVGAMTRQAVLERDAEVAAAVPLLARATPLIGHFQIRNRGTAGGSLAHADPASEYPAVAVALRATFEIAGAKGSRTVDATTFFEGTWRTCLQPDELLTAVRFPVASASAGAADYRSGFAIEEMARREGDFALAGAAGAVDVAADGTVARIGIGLFGVGPTPVRAEAAEHQATGRPAAELLTSPAPLDELGRLAAEPLDPPDDVHATGSYRRKVVAHLVTRALRAALEEATHG
jgi:carbon-monoxide dehydrogenase medium subunit